MTAQDFTTIDLTVDDDGIALLTLDRPDQLNSFSVAMVDELVAAFDRIDADDEIRAVVVTGAGRAFSAGADLSAGEATFDYEAVEGEGAELRTADGVHRDRGGVLTLRVFACLKPVIAAVNGPAVGLGATVQLPMDARLASTGARFGFVFARRGLVPDGAASWFLPRVVGIPTALEWCYSGRTFTADEALAKGLVQSLHEPDELVPAARAVALAMVERSAPVSVALTRQLVWRMAAAPHPMEAHRLESRALTIRGASADVREGVMSFLEKRPAQFPLHVSTDLPGVLPDEPEFA